MGIRCDGTFSQTANGRPVCDGSWVEEPDVLTQLYDLLNLVFSTPEPIEVGAAFMAGFTLPMIAFLVAWGYGIVISFASNDRSELD